MTAEVVEGRPVTKENIMGQAPTQLSVGLVYGVPNASHDVREGARRDYPEDLLHSSRYANSTLPQGASKVRTVCGSSRKHGSVRGVAGNGHPYCDASAGINRRAVGDERALQERRSEIHLDLESCAGRREEPGCCVDRGIGGRGIELRKTQSGCRPSACNGKAISKEDENFARSASSMDPA